MDILKLAEIPRSDGNPEIHDFPAHTLMVQRILRLSFDLAEGRKGAEISRIMCSSGYTKGLDNTY